MGTSGTCVFRRQELEERCLLNLYQNWEERAEEHLTLKQEEGEAWPGKPLARPGRTLRPLGFIDPGWGVVYRSGGCPVPTPAPWSGPGDYLARGLCRVGGWPKLTHHWVGGQNSCWVLLLGVRYTSRFHGHLAE